MQVCVLSHVALPIGESMYASPAYCSTSAEWLGFRFCCTSFINHFSHAVSSTTVPLPRCEHLQVTDVPLQVSSLLHTAVCSLEAAYVSIHACYKSRNHVSVRETSEGSPCRSMYI